MTIEITTDDRVDVIDVTAEIEAAIPDAVESGICTVFVRHTTAGVIINEADGRLLEDIETILERLIPRGDGYRHDQLDGNADGHLRAMLLGESVTIPIENGSLAAGTWQSVLFVECDGPRRRTLTVTVVSD